MKSEKKNNTLEDLISIVKKLRSPDGCEWDKKQTHESLIPYFLEESHEVVEAIESQDYESLKENRIAGAGIDVFNKEPLEQSHIFWTHPNVTVTPHIASITVIDSAIENSSLLQSEYDLIVSTIEEINKKIEEITQHPIGGQNQQQMILNYRRPLILFTIGRRDFVRGEE